MIKRYQPDIKLRFGQIEIVGTGLVNNKKPFMNYKEENDTWNIKTSLKNGGIKFNSDNATYLRWGKDIGQDEILKF